MGLHELVEHVGIDVKGKTITVDGRPLPAPPRNGAAMSSLEATDAAAEAVRKGGFRVTLDDLKAAVADVEYVERGTLNVALVRLHNGWWLVGKSAPVDPANYDADYGRQLAFDDALRQAWPLLAYAHLDAQQPS